MKKIITAAVAATLLLLGAVSASADENKQAEAVDYCDPANKPSGSIKEWLEDNNEVSSGCVEFEITIECGQLDVTLTNKTGLFYEVRALADASPAYTGGEGVNTFGVTFDEDEHGGSVDVAVWVEGAEADYLTDSGVPNFWDENASVHAVETDCEEPEPTETPTQDPTPTEEPTVEPTEEPEPTVTPTQTTPASAERLPDTGASPLLLTGIGIALLLTGGAAVLARRHKLH